MKYALDIKKVIYICHGIKQDTSYEFIRQQC